MNLPEQFKQYLLSQKTPPSKTTVKNYKADIGQFIRWHEAEFKKKFEPAEVTPQIIEVYKKAKDSLSPRSLERHLSSLRKFFHFMKLEGMISSSPFEKLTVSAEALAKTDPYRLKDFKNHLYVYNKAILTIKNYLMDARQFLRWTEEVSGVKNAWDIKDKDIFGKIDSFLLEEYKNRLLQNRMSPTSINRKLSSIRTYLKWADSEGMIRLQTSEFRVQSLLKEKAKLQEVVWEPQNQQSNNRTIEQSESYSPFPPLRLAQKVTKGINSLFDHLLVAPLAKITEQAEYVLWKLRGKPVFVGRSSKPSLQPLISNIKKEFYAPLSISAKYFPLHKKLWHHLRHTRPKWYKAYHSYPVAHYFHFAILVIFTTVVGFSVYRVLATQPQEQQPIFAAPTSPPRILSFQGRLTDSVDNPIVSQTALRMAIYNSETATSSALLWQETVTVTPDLDGIFSTLLGNNTKIPQSLFADNASLFLGVTVGATPELTPRQQLATVAYATNAELLQGLPPITQSGAGTKNVVLALDSSGNLTIAATPTFTATGGTFKLSGKPLLLSTNDGTNANVQISPDGTGKIDLQKPIQNTTDSNNSTGSPVGAVEIDDMLYIFATSAASALTINQTSSGPLISASASGSTKFSVSNAGAGTFADDLAVNGGDLTTTATTFNLVNATATTVNFAGAATTLSIGATTGTTTVNNALTVTGATTLSSTLAVTGNTTLTGDLAVNGGDFTSTATTFNLLNSTVTTLNLGGAATTLSIGASTGTTTVNNALTVTGATTLSSTLAVTGDTTLTGDLAVNGGDLT
ncbi:MAG: site-specific integrase, partial [Candidatus Levybacteria bacterium]|nr:site-specific integrase [Candidatus Levybacteria bacterium]